MHHKHRKGAGGGLPMLAIFNRLVDQETSWMRGPALQQEDSFSNGMIKVVTDCCILEGTGEGQNE